MYTFIKNKSRQCGILLVCTYIRTYVDINLYRGDKTKLYRTKQYFGFVVEYLLLRPSVTFWLVSCINHGGSMDLGNVGVACAIRCTTCSIAERV